MGNDSAEDDEGEHDDVYAQYVRGFDVLPRAGLNLIVLIVSGCRAPKWLWVSTEATQEHGTFIRIHSILARAVSKWEMNHSFS